jgi:hypothetical protein
MAVPPVNPFVLSASKNASLDQGSPWIGSMLPSHAYVQGG